MNVIKGECTALIHSDNITLSKSFLDFTGKFLNKYFAELAVKEGGRKTKLPRHTIIQTDDPGFLIVQSFRYSSDKDTILRIVQRFTTSHPSVIFDGKENRERITISFYTLLAKDVPATSLSPTKH